VEDSEDKIIYAVGGEGYGEEVARGKGGEDGDQDLELSVMHNLSHPQLPTSLGNAPIPAHSFAILLTCIYNQQKDKNKDTIPLRKDWKGRVQVLL
jgi:hypothetical protein